MDVVGAIVVGLLVMLAGRFFWTRGPEVFAGQRETLLRRPYRVLAFDVWMCRLIAVVFVVGGVAMVVYGFTGADSGDGVTH